MTADLIDLYAAVVEKSPDVRDWAITLRITRLRCTPDGGFLIEFDQPVPERWKWASNPAVPTDNFQYTVWFWIPTIATMAHYTGAGFVQMWQGREMGVGTPQGHAIPPIFNVPPGDRVPGWRNLWGDPSRWPNMSTYTPTPGDQVGIMVSAGDARLRRGVTSVAERSNIVLFTLQGDDRFDLTFADSPPIPGPDPPPIVPPIILPPETVLAGFAQLEAKINLLQNTMNLILLRPGPIYEGTVQVPYIGTGKVTLTPKP